jgi:hypothetical protein
MATLTDPAAYLAQHYVYELNMLRWTDAQLRVTPTGFLANALIESFCVHARALMDFYKSSGRGDDVVATDFITAGQFAARATSQISPDIRDRVNKQVAHLTGARENPTKKVDKADRKTLLTAIEADHTAFKNAVNAQFVGCFKKELAVTSSVSVSGNASATNAIQTSGTNS